MSGVFGARDGAYRRVGIVAGTIFLLLAGALFLSGRIR